MKKEKSVFKMNKEKMNEYLTKAFRSLTIEEVKQIIDWLLIEKMKCYEAILRDTDVHFNFITLNSLEEKLGNILVNLVQERDLRNLKRVK